MPMVSAGRAELAKRLAGDASVRPTHLALGTGTTAVSDADTALETETFRKALATAYSDGTTAVLEAFLESAEANGTHREVGLLSAATAGTLITRDLITETKAAGETLTVSIEIAVNQG